MIKIKTPTSYPISQLFGNPDKMYTNLGLNAHNGLDFACPIGTPIVACLDGVVEYVGQDSKGGIGVYIIHEKEGLKSIYWHFTDYVVKVGQKVKQGDIVGISGNTGMSTGPHLHFGLKKVEKKGGMWVNVDSGDGWNGSVDPLDYIDSINIVGNWKKGAKGTWVKKIQELLNSKGSSLVIDGDFGKMTKLAVQAFQLKNHVVADGTVGKVTWGLLLK
jgi:murein DD-endopeptidase MepM/ murein hydrolase activator NlpD